VKDPDYFGLFENIISKLVKNSKFKKFKETLAFTWTHPSNASKICQSQVAITIRMSLALSLKH
jgi:hypothetical protein